LEKKLLPSFIFSVSPGFTFLNTWTALLTGHFISILAITGAWLIAAYII
jgi:hypothetical protein